MCTVGYSKRLNVIFKNRDKTGAVDEVTVVKPNYFAIKTEGAKYYSLGVNDKGVGFASTAVNTPAWTALASEGKCGEADAQFKIENEGLVNPMIFVSELLPEVECAEQLIEKLLARRELFMGYNLLVADRSKAFHVELYRDKSHTTPVYDQIIIANHFKTVDHGPKSISDYPNSFERFEAAQNLLSNLGCLEDLFSKLVPHGGQNCPYWRFGPFRTVSSSIMDLDASTLYHCMDPDAGYSRLTKGIPPKGSERIAIEMSRYIDLPTYHKIERGHPFYEEMIQEVLAQIKSFHNTQGGSDALRTLELGAGTGLCSLELVNLPFLDLKCLELDSMCCAILAEHPESSRYEVIQGDAVTFRDDHGFDLIVSTFAHDHIHYNLRFNFAENIYKNLRKGGRYIMGGELLPYFSSDADRKRSLFTYHNYIIELALRESRIQLCELENNALKSGLDLVGDFKRHEKMFEEEMLSAGFKVVSKVKLGPLDRSDVGGVFVYVCEA